mgnify:CR=1 FL=1
MTGAQAVVRSLEELDVDTIFGIPGGAVLPVYDPLFDSQKLRHVLVRHEQGAGFMADGYARVTGRPGVCFIITGPGMTNILTAMGQAYADSIPMLVISSVNRTEQLAMGQGRLHELPSQQAVVAGVTAFSHTILHPSQLPEVLARAFALFSSARPRPVHIEIPTNVITASADDLPLQARPLPSRPGPDPESIVRAAALLARAERPLLVLGGGAVGAAAEARALAERLDAAREGADLVVSGRVVGLPQPGEMGTSLLFAPDALALASGASVALPSRRTTSATLPDPPISSAILSAASAAASSTWVGK